MSSLPSFRERLPFGGMYFAVAEIYRSSSLPIRATLRDPSPSIQFPRAMPDPRERQIVMHRGTIGSSTCRSVPLNRPSVPFRVISSGKGGIRSYHRARAYIRMTAVRVGRMNAGQLCESDKIASARRHVAARVSFISVITALCN